MYPHGWFGHGGPGHHSRGFGPHHSLRPGWFGFGPVRRGDMQPSILRVLQEKPMHGYEIMRAIEAKSQGAWRPSPGSIYPTLQMLEEQELVTGREEGGKRVYALTDKGKKEAAKAAGPETEEFEHAALADKLALRELVFESMGLLKEIAWRGSDTDREAVKKILTETRDQLRGLVKDSKADDQS